MTPEDTDAVHEIMQAMDAIEHPNYLTTREEVVEELGYSFLDLEHDTVLGLTVEGRPVAVGAVLEPPRQETLVREFLNGGVHPEFWGKGIGRELLAWQLARGRQKLAVSQKRLPGWLVGYADARAERRARILRRAGLEPTRYFLALDRDLSDPIPQVTPTEDVRIVPFTAGWAEATHAARDEAFLDHWGSQPLSDEQWQGFLSGTFAPEVSFLAVAGSEDGGEVAGLVLCQVNEEDWEAQGFTGAYISVVGTTRAYRGKRIASALLGAVLRACADRGWERATLDVDSESPTGALGLYTEMGFVETNRETAFVVAY